MNAVSQIPVIAIFDVGKTNKKLLLFNEDYKVVYQEEEQFAETKDEDGFPCEDLELLSGWVKSRLEQVLRMQQYKVAAVNFAAYGASFVHLNDQGKPFLPLYNYLKPYPERLQEQFYNTYGGASACALETASPVLGHLNSGMQLYWLKHTQPEVFSRIICSLHLPQFLSYLLTGKMYSDVTSIGCHTGLWNFKENSYHKWVSAEGVDSKLAPLCKYNDAVKVKVGTNKLLTIGAGLHDSSAALVSYLMFFQEPFVLISTGTWCISLNPFNAQPLTGDELRQDCLCYLTYKGAAVKAARIFAGHEHEQQTKKIAEHFGLDPAFYKSIAFNAEIAARLKSKQATADDIKGPENVLQQSFFCRRNLACYTTAEEAYHQLIADLVMLQYESTTLVLKGSAVKHIFVDGGFSSNKIFMHLLAAAFPQVAVCAASVAQASALGAALVLHQHWNKKPLPSNIIELDCYHSAPVVNPKGSFE